ncbi:MAG TPA: hypothetical protein VHY91_25865 [Pirellulales bacterium]|jgi:hypothetical protein|nr:hypothetical protein [Pirellulales bacterium]
MARQEQPRENLIAEATALVERVELLLAGEPEPAVAGFRRDGSASLFFGDDPVYQFNARGQLRRAFVDGRLYKADAGRLVEVTRRRHDDRIQLAGRELTADESAEFIAALRTRLDDFGEKLASGQVRASAQVPPHADVIARLGQWLVARSGAIEIANRPHAR